MKKILYALVLVFFTFATAHAQELITDANILLKQGIYANFNEFKNNNPSIAFPANYQIVESVEKYGGALYGGGKHTVYKLTVNKKPVKDKQEIYGFCDGNFIYVNPEMPDMSKKKTTFDKLTSVGRYCTYKSIKTNVKPYGVRLLQANSKVISNSLGPAYSSGKIVLLNEYVLDINTGDVLRLSKNAVEDYLATDPELSASFKAEKKPRQVLESYIIQYAKKHPEEIKE